ncbi:hypothetical protein GCM10009759_78840 [Kitasatospora saccharophila]|uniref:Uncharacterized protein n=1 Tax=Kitasatospora saccharophila TaxID=407973 RepID=A0ABN2YEV1_9ACTN
MRVRLLPRSGPAAHRPRPKVHPHAARQATGPADRLHRSGRADTEATALATRAVTGRVQVFE